MPYWPTPPKSLKVRREVLERERARLLAQQQAYAQIEAQRVQRILAAGPEVAAAIVGVQEAQDRLTRARQALGEDAGGMAGMVRQQRLDTRLEEITEELEDLAT
jgi:hypothetical protein